MNRHFSKEVFQVAIKHVKGMQSVTCHYKPTRMAKAKTVNKTKRQSLQPTARFVAIRMFMNACGHVTLQSHLGKLLGVSTDPVDYIFVRLKFYYYYIYIIMYNYMHIITTHTHTLKEHS